MKTTSAPRPARAVSSISPASSAPRSIGVTRVETHDEDRPVDDTLRARRPLYIATILVLLAGIVLSQPALVITGMLLAVLAVLPEIWYRFGLRALTLDHEVSLSRAAFGDIVDVTLVVENRKLLPLPWLQIDDEFPDDLPVLGVHLDPSGKTDRARLRNTLALWAFQRVRRRARVGAVVRGAYTFGPMTVRVTDPFGILVQEGRCNATKSLLVYPLIAPIERFGLDARALFGERSTPQRLLEDPLRIGGVRAYEPGDEPRRIHWKATARTGTLQSKIYEPSSRHTVAIAVDVRTFRNALFGSMPELVELAVSAASSVAVWAMEQGYSLGLMSNGTLSATGGELGTTSASTFRLRVPPSARPEQLALVLDGLARLQPDFAIPIEQVLEGEQRTLPRGSTIVYIGSEAMLDVPVILQLRRMQTLGYAVTLLLTTGDALAGIREDEHVVHLPNLPTHYLGGASAWRTLIADVLGAGELRRATSSLYPGLTDEQRAAILRGVHLHPSDAAPEPQPKGGSENDHANGELGADESGLRKPGGPRTLALE